MGVLMNLIGFLLTIGVVVTWHELGHYWAAKWAGVKVLRFSIGFGNVLKRWTVGRDREEWAISAIPMGGYVKMLDEREGDVPADELERAFTRKSLFKRSVIVAAGPFANFVLAIALLAALNMSGVSETRPLLDEPSKGSSAAQAGLAAGDEIVSVNGEAVQSWNDARWRLLLKAGGSAQVSVKTDKGRLVDVDVNVPSPSGDDKRDPVSVAGFTLFNPMPPLVGVVEQGSAAQAADLRVGDLLEAVNGQPVARWAEVTKVIAASPRLPMTIAVRRGSERLTLQATPVASQRDGVEIGRLGMGVKPDLALIESTHRTVHYGPIEALSRAAVRTWDLSVFTLKMMVKIVSGQASLRNISGPVAMADYAGQSIQIGLPVFVGFLALVSISIGVLNLLPIPMLDGGHLLYHAFEALRGSPPSLRMLEWGQRIGLGFVISLMCLAFYNDITRYFIGR